mgnify:FL=1
MLLKKKLIFWKYYYLKSNNMNDLVTFLKSKKTIAEMPNNRTTAYNVGYVAAINQVLNLLNKR